jgi:hypothetical protein
VGPREIKYLEHMQRVLPLSLFALVFACDTSTPTDEPESFRSLGDIEVIAAFNPMLGETPESVAIDQDNNAYIMMALTGEIRKITPAGTQSTLAWLPLGQCAPNPFPPIAGALAIDFWQNLYVGISACDPDDKGIWKVTPEGSATRIASLPTDALPNGITVLAGQVYAADSAAPRIWRAPTSGDGSPAEVWTTSPLLQDPNPFDLAPGANGLQTYLGEIFVANAGAGTLVAIPLEHGDEFVGDFDAGEAYVKYGPAGSGAEIETPPFPTFPGCDDFAFDVLGRVYCTTDPFQSVLRINLDGSVDTILEPSDGIDGPTAAAFGRKQDRKILYVSNAAFPFFPGTGNGPSLMAVEVGLPGYPLR